MEVFFPLFDQIIITFIGCVQRKCSKPGVKWIQFKELLIFLPQFCFILHF
jgi:hypothetical protein